MDGDDQAKQWLVERWTPPIYRFCWRMLGNDEDARDATQDTMVKILRYLHRYELGRPFQSWAFRIARNTCIDEHRKRARRAWDEPGEIVDTAPTPLDQTESQQQADTLLLALDKLPPMYREILVLYHFEHLKYAEIASTLDLPIGTVMNRIFRARKKLRDCYSAEGGRR